MFAEVLEESNVEGNPTTHQDLLGYRISDPGAYAVSSSNSKGSHVRSPVSGPITPSENDRKTTQRHGPICGEPTRLNCGSTTGRTGLAAEAQSGPLGYQYDIPWTIGRVDRYGTAERALQIFKSRPQDFFPFPVSQCERFYQNAVCHLNAPVVVGGVGDVRVTVAPTEIRFTVISEGYFDGVGSTITFRFLERDGVLEVVQSARSTVSIVTNPHSRITPKTSGNFVGGYEVIAPTGQTAVFDKDGVFRYFGNESY